MLTDRLDIGPPQGALASDRGDQPSQLGADRSQDPEQQTEGPEPAWRTHALAAPARPSAAPRRTSPQIPREACRCPVNQFNMAARGGYSGTTAPGCAGMTARGGCSGTTAPGCAGTKQVLPGSTPTPPWADRGRSVRPACNRSSGGTGRQRQRRTAIAELAAPARHTHRSTPASPGKASRPRAALARSSRSSALSCWGSSQSRSTLTRSAAGVAPTVTTAPVLVVHPGRLRVVHPGRLGLDL